MTLTDRIKVLAAAIEDTDNEPTVTVTRIHRGCFCATVCVDGQQFGTGIEDGRAGALAELARLLEAKARRLATSMRAHLATLDAAIGGAP